MIRIIMQSQFFIYCILGHNVINNKNYYIYMSLQQNFDLETPTPLGDDDYEFDDSNKLDPPNI